MAASTTSKKKSTKTQSQVINLQRDGGCKKMRESGTRVPPFAPLLMQNSPSSVRFGKYDIFQDWYKNLFVLNDNALFGTGHIFENYYGLDPKFTAREVVDVFRDQPAAFVIRNPLKKTKYNENCSVILLLNGDEDSGEADPYPEFSLVGDSELEKYKFPTFSLNCFSRFYKNNSQAIKALRKGEAVLLDFNADDYLDMTEDELKLLDSGNRKKPLLPPKSGYSVVRRRWHRAATVLIYDKNMNSTFLIGQDEGTYFGVELPKNCKTLEEAFTMLIPKEVRNKEFLRQGEWFAVEVNKEEVPKPEEAVLIIENPFLESRIHLPRETPASNMHWFEGGEILVGKNGVVYFKGCQLNHDQHESMELRSVRWYRFYKNTAVRSFSQGGVD